MILPFTPGSFGSFTAGLSSNNRLAFPGNGTTLRVYNSGSVVVYVKAGDSTVEATTSDWFVAPNQTVNFCIAGTATHVAATTGVGTTALTLISRGTGGV